MVFQCQLGCEWTWTERSFGIARCHSDNASDSGDGEQSILQGDSGAYVRGVWKAGCLRIVPGNGESPRRWSLYTRVSAEFCKVMFIVK